MAIFLEPPEFLIGLRAAVSGSSPGPFEHYVERTQPEGSRSGPGDLDLVAYSLRKWLRLALAGNPTVLLLLFSPPEFLLVCNVNRPELVEAHGFDTKYAMHVARLGLQGIELLSTGRLTLPMAEPDRSRVMAIRHGDVPLDETLAQIDEIERQLHAAVESSPLPEEPDYESVDTFLLDSYRQGWGCAEPS
jgi:hypothetical protein